MKSNRLQVKFFFLIHDFILTNLKLKVFQWQERIIPRPAANSVPGVGDSMSGHPGWFRKDWFAVAAWLPSAQCPLH